MSLSEGCFFECTALEKVVLPSSVTKLGSSVFSGCSKLEKVTIKGKLKTIPATCFARCKSLEDFEIPSTVKTINSQAFAGCTLLTEIELPSSMKTITSFAFYGSCLEKISIPSSVTTVERNAFYNCKNLYQVVFTKGTTKIHYEAFEGCDRTRLTIVAPKNSMAYKIFMDTAVDHNTRMKKTMVATNTKFGFNINSNLMVVGEKKQFAAKNYSGTLKWKSSNSSVLKITSSGMATAKKTGTVTLTATADTQKFTFKIKVLKRTMDNAMKVITTEYARPEMSDFEKAYGAFWWLVENVKYDYDTYEAYKKGDWKNQNMDSYAAKGALESGLAVCDGYAKAFKKIMDYYEIPCKRVISKDADHAWNAIEIDGKWYYVDATWKEFMFDDEGMYGSHGFPDNFSYKTYSYDTINTTSRTKSANSSVKAAELTINPYLNAIKTTLTVGGNHKFTLKLTGAKVKSFTSKNPSVATVSKKGVITAKKKGTTTIKVKAANGKNYSCTVKVDNPKLNKTNLKLNKGKTYTLNITGTSQTIIWKVADTKVATITAKGKVKAVGQGTTQITTTVNGKKLTCKVTVHEHSYKKTITKAATCTSKGTTKYTCSCGASYTKTIAALGHNYQWKVTKQASTTTAKSEADFGTRVLACKNCKDKKQTESIINMNGKLIYGYFDDKGAVLLRNAVNEARAYYGLSGVTLLPSTQLEAVAKFEVVKYAYEYDAQALHSGGDAISTSDYKGIACCEGAAYDYVAEKLRQGASGIFMNADAEHIGTACFYYAVGEYKSDGSGGSYGLYHIMLLK